MHLIRKGGGVVPLTVESRSISALWTVDGETRMVVAGGSGTLNIAEDERAILEACGTNSGLCVPGYDEVEAKRG